MFPDGGITIQRAKIMTLNTERQNDRIDPALHPA